MALDIKTITDITNASAEDLTSVQKALNENILTEKNTKVIEILKRIDPDRYRDILALAEKESELAHVKPGDLITADLINSLIDRINALEIGADSVLKLGPLATQTHTLVALGGAEAAGAGLWVDGERLLDKSNEIANIALLDGSTLDARLLLSGDGTKLLQAFEQLQKAAKKGDVLMAQITFEEAATGGGTSAVTTKASYVASYLGVIQDVNQIEAAEAFLNSIQNGQQPFAWGLYSVKFKRFVIGGASDDVRIQQLVARVRTTG